MTERIAVYGAGAIGAQIGGRLHTAGHDVTVIEPWTPQREAMAANGLTVHTSDGDEHHHPPVLSPDAMGDLAGPVDVLFLAVKSYDTVEAIRIAKPHLAPDALVVSMQNSINEEALVQEVAAERLLGGVILINGVLDVPGEVTLTSSVSRASANLDLPGVEVGEYLRPASEQAVRVARILDSVWAAVTTDDLLHERWMKLATNTMVNTVCGVSGLGSAAMLADATARRALILIGAEVLRVADAEGYALETLLGDYTADEVLADATGNTGVVDRGLAGRAKRVSADAAPSLLQDVRRGRRTEVDYFSGLVGAKGRKHGIATPVCDMSTELLHTIERGEIAPSPELLGRLA